MVFTVCREIIPVSKNEIKTSLSREITLQRKDKKKGEEERRGKERG